MQQANWVQSSRAKRLQINAAWLVHLRLAAVIGQFITIMTVTAMGIRLPLLPLSLVLFITAATNGVFVSWERNRNRKRDWEAWADRGDMILSAIMLLDLLSLTALLYFTGGTSNPFVVFFLVNVALSAVLVPAHWAWRIVAVAIACLGLLVFFHQPLPVLEPALLTSQADKERAVWLSRTALWISYSACAGVIVNFITRVTAALQASEQQVRLADRRQANLEKVEALATLSAGAAHELATPLSTISVVAAELQREVTHFPSDSLLREDLDLIRSELERCRTILDRMAGKAGEIANEGLSLTTASEIVEESLTGVRRKDRVQTRLEDQVERLVCRVPRQGLAQALRGLIQNALDATEPSGSVTVTASCHEGALQLLIADDGTGIAPEVLQRIGEPFFTTKAPGGGMGLGVFLAKNVIERLGGQMHVQSELGKGTVVTVALPTDQGSRANAESHA